ncbi:hypothetical protein AVEN_82639-1, partial [Araneus ventricosus]
MASSDAILTSSFGHSTFIGDAFGALQIGHGLDSPKISSET